MTQEDEKILLIDLAARVPYEVKISVELDENKLVGTLNAVYPSENRVIVDNLDKAIAAINVRCGGFILNENNVKPYLRSLSSMSEKEKSELYEVFLECPTIIKTFSSYTEFFIYADIINSIDMVNVIDWFNAHHFDYRGLIERGLALEAPKGMYKFE